VHVSNTVRLLKLSDTVKAHINAGRLTAGHARMLIGQPNAEDLADEIIRRGLNVRQVEARARQDGRQNAARLRGGAAPKDADTAALQKRLSDALGLTVTIDHRANGSGVLHIRYRSLDQLDDVVRRLERAP
jgi:ParB family chromosome partitioning protein